jgi:pimeloyl-ACP methyl ester carboxylesterase
VAKLKQHYKIIRMDLPAFGLTGPHPEGDYSIESYAGFVLDFLAALEIDSFHIAGNSLGGHIAWNIAADYPERVKKMILLNASGFPSEKSPSWIFKIARTPVVNQVFKYFTPKFIIKNNLDQVYHDDTKITKELVERYHDMALRKGNRTAFIDRSKTIFTDHTAKLKNIQTPTLILWGQEDIWIPVRDSQKFMDQISVAEVIIMPDTGHIPMEESPELSAKIALEFLDDPKKYNY